MLNSIFRFSVLVAFLPFSATSQPNFWEQTNGITGEAVYPLEINASGYIYAGTVAGAFRSTNNGDNWTQINSGLSNPTITALAISQTEHTFAGTFGGGMFRSTDNGDNWTQINAGLTDLYVGAIEISSNGHIYIGTYMGSVFRSIDNGNNWAITNTGFFEPSVWSLSINTVGHIFAGTYGDGIFRSTDNGDNFIQIPFWELDSPPYLYVYSLKVNSAGHIFAGTRDALFSNQSRIFRSQDNGDSWSILNNGPTAIVNAMVITDDGQIFAGTGFESLSGEGVFRSIDNGDNWTEVNSGLGNLNVMALAIAPDGRIFAGTADGVFRSVQAPPGCCIGARDDANSDGTGANFLDLTYLVDRIFRSGPPSLCQDEADFNSDGASANILDLTFLVDRIFRGGPAPASCF